MKPISLSNYRPPLVPPAPPPVVTREQLLAVYNPPFKLCHHGLYVYDSKGETVADFLSHDGTGFRVRGYGMMKTRFRHPNAIFDAMEDFLLDVVKDCSSDKAQCVKSLNEAWGHST